MIYTITFNPSIDYIATTNDMELGATNRTTREMMIPGGKGINVSTVLNNFGIDNIALGFAGGYTGREICSMLDARKLAHDFVEVQNGLSRINVKIRSLHSDELSSETELNGMGPMINSEELNELYKKLDNYLADKKASNNEETDFIILAGKASGPAGDDTYADICRKYADEKVKIIVDATGKQLLNTLEYKPFLIKPNAAELGELFEVKVNSLNDAGEYAVRLCDMGAENVLVSMGGHGAVLVSKDGTRLSASAPKGNPVNTVGAGDSMVAGFVAGYLNAEFTENISDDALTRAFYTALCAGSASAFKEDFACTSDVKMLLEGFDKS